MTLSWQGARRVAHGSAAPLEPELVALSAALGRVLADPLRSLVDVPGVDTVAMDGWAVRGPGPWTVVGASAAGGPALELGEGDAVDVATGSQLPGGATGVLRREDGSQPEGRLTGRARDTDVRPRGEQCRAGEVVLPTGTRLGPPALGLAAAVGADHLRVIRRARVAAVILGDEVTSSGAPAAGQVRDSLGPQLPGWVAHLGGQLVGSTRVPDDRAGTVSALGVDADVVVVTGGTSGGRGDHLRPALSALGAELLVDSVDVRPGHPMLLSRLPAGTLVVGVPGNPLAAVAALTTLLWPLLDGLLGRVLAVPPCVQAAGLSPPSQGVALVPCDLQGGTVSPVGYSGPAMLRGVAMADGLAAVGADGSVLWLAFPWA